MHVPLDVGVFIRVEGQIAYVTCSGWNTRGVSPDQSNSKHSVNYYYMKQAFEGHHVMHILG